MKVAWPASASSMAVVDDFGEQVMQRLLVGAADIHAGPAPHRLKAFEHLDVGRGVAGFGAGCARGGLERGAALRLGGPEQIVSVLVLAADFNGLAIVLHMLRARWAQRIGLL